MQILRILHMVNRKKIAWKGHYMDMSAQEILGIDIEHGTANLENLYDILQICNYSK